MWLDVIITDGFVVDGTGNVWFRADLGVKDGMITDIGGLKSMKAERIIDAKGLFVSPGFIDIHGHSDSTILLTNRCESKIMQGVTTECVGNCGSSPYPITKKNRELVIKRMSRMTSGDEMKIDWTTLDGYIWRVKGRGVSINVAALVGHGTVRAAVVGMEDRAPTPSELEEMKAHVEEAMRDGAFGVSSGLDYSPGCYAKTGEVVELMRVAAKYGGIYASHVREENLHSTIKAVEECIRIGEKSGARVTHMAHIHPKYPNWGQESEILRMIEEARKRDTYVTADTHLVMQSHQKLSNIIPPWWRKRGSEELIENLKVPETRRKIKVDFLTRTWDRTGVLPLFRNMAKDGHWGDINLCSLYRQKMLKNQGNIGKSISEIAELRGLDPFDALCELIIEERDNVYGLCRGSQESAKMTLIRHPAIMVATDCTCKAATKPWTDTYAKPLADYGSYPYVFGKWVRRDHVLSLEEMVRKCTSLPARTLGLRDRGLIAKGMYADIVIFNMETIDDKSTHENPHQYPEGVEYVLVNGQIVVDGGQHTCRLPGTFLRHPSY